ncbi:class A beta-lactamase-related serine hydrolase [Brevibacillus ruminantium]|uniref:Class A beta-lactamase-related serine hydrolase n=1 Tax=Brevibacillus ruminantium TaxID=2950604 RepID=A0ABY4WEK3_9BACL|nr:serine hydrolase [Brevibacillus ruminantium]USG65478.1 class A beta-lactamase-related serine hydrolase [Brevibacillus ruminantium]
MNFHELQQQIQHLASTFQGKSSIAIETADGAILINENEQLPSASLIKVPIMIEAYRQAQEDTLDLSQKYTVPPHLRVGGTGVVAHLSDEVSLSLEDLISLMIMISDNSATNLLIEKVGMDAVNRLAHDLGCRQTALQRKMLDFQAIEEGKNNFTSAADMVRFVKEIVVGTTLGQSAKQATYRTLQHQQHQTTLPALITGGFSLKPVIAHKTGELPGMVHDAGIFQVNDKYAYVAVLTTDLPDNATGQQMIAKVGKAVYDYLSVP